MAVSSATIPTESLLFIPECTILPRSKRAQSGPPPSPSRIIGTPLFPNTVVSSESFTGHRSLHQRRSLTIQTEFRNSTLATSEDSPSVSSPDSPPEHCPTLTLHPPSDTKQTRPQYSDTLDFSNMQSTFDHHHDQTAPRYNFSTDAAIYSSHFPQYHQLNYNFVQAYQLKDELGSGGYGFVMTALDRAKGQEVAVKFIVKEKVPEHAWMDDAVYGRLPTEVVLLSFIQHENVVKFLDLFEDHLHFYLVQELHGCPWKKGHNFEDEPFHPNCSYSSSLSTPALSPSSSIVSLPASEPGTPPTYYISLREDTIPCNDDIPTLLQTHLSISQSSTRPEITRRPSHDLFECIEQLENKRLSEAQARFVFGQVVDVVDYLDHHGIAHRDIKDENLVVDMNLKVKLIDFGSAISVDPITPRPFYNTFFGTAAYASSEILQKMDYQAAPAEVWTLGVLLSYLLAGISPFPNVRDAIDGRIFLSQKVVGKISPEAMDLMRQCLDPNPNTRLTVSQIKSHPWLVTY